MSAKSCCSLPPFSNLNHCAQCHQTFNSLKMFDRHQDIARDGSGRVSCRPPEALGLVSDTRGTWRTPEAVESLYERIGMMKQARKGKVA